MANIRTLKLNLLADTTDFAKGIKKATGQTESFSTKVGNSLKSVAKSAALAGVAVAGMAVKFGIDAVKAAIADERSQKRLALALKNTTKATNTQIKSVENFILKTSLAKGVVDDKLRPAYQRLVQATGSMAKSQDLLNLALNVSAGTGKDVETVSNALARAYDGNFTALKKLGVKIDDNIIKTKDFAAAQKALDDVYKGQAIAKANTLEGRLQRFSIAVNEFKESVGYRLLPIITKAFARLSPILTNVAAGLLGEKGVVKGIKNLDEVVAAQNIGKSITNLIKALGQFASGLFNKDFDKKSQNLAESLQSIADSINAITDAINAVKPAIEFLLKLQKYLPNLLTVTRVLKGIGTGLSAIPKGFSGLAGARATGGPVSAGGTYLVGERGPELVTLGSNGYVTPNKNLRGNTTIILNGIVDAESARRSIEQVLQSSSIRTVPVQVQGSLI